LNDVDEELEQLLILSEPPPKGGDLIMLRRETGMQVSFVTEKSLKRKK